jgi:hypothetical protein
VNQPFQHPLLASLTGAELRSIAERAVSDPRWRSSERLLRKIGQEDLISEVVVGILESTRRGRWASSIPARAIAWKAACWGMTNIINDAMRPCRADRYASGHVSFLKGDSGREVDVFEELPDERPNPEIELLYRESCLDEDGEELRCLDLHTPEIDRLKSRRFEAVKLNSLRTKVARAGDRTLGPSLIAYPVAIQTERLLAALASQQARANENKALVAAIKDRRRERFATYILRLCPWVKDEIAGLPEQRARQVISRWTDRIRAISPDGSLTAFSRRSRPLHRDEATGELLAERPRPVPLPKPSREPRPPRPPKPPNAPFLRAPELSLEEVRRRRNLSTRWQKFKTKQASRCGLLTEVERLEKLPLEERVAEARSLVEARGGFPPRRRGQARPPKPSKETRPPKPSKAPSERDPKLSPEEVRRRGLLASTWMKFRKKQAARYGLQGEVERLANLPADERIAEIRRLIAAKGGFQRGKPKVFESTEQRIKVLGRWCSFKTHWAKAYGLQHLVPELQDLPTLERDARVRAVMDDITAQGLRLKKGPRSPSQKTVNQEVKP